MVHKFKIYEQNHEGHFLFYSSLYDILYFKVLLIFEVYLLDVGSYQILQLGICVENFPCKFCSLESLFSCVSVADQVNCMNLVLVSID